MLNTSLNLELEHALQVLFEEKKIVAFLTKWFAYYFAEKWDEDSILSQCEGLRLDDELKRKLKAFVKLVGFSRIHEDAPLRLDSPQKIWESFSSLKYEENEKVTALFLSARHDLISSKLLALGSHNKVHLQALDVIRPAVVSQAKNIVLIHNHPSGDVEPSEEDFVFTKKCQRATELIGLKLVDHLIFGPTKFYSFRRAGLL